MKPYVLHPEADLEYTAAAEHYAAISLPLAGKFFDEIERLIADVRARPQTYRFLQSPVRRHFSHRFPFGILYVERPSEILILAVMHLKRAPDYWTQRLP